MKDNNLLYQSIGDDLNLGTLDNIEVIQSLWSNYGELVRLNFKNKSVIVKHIKLPENSSHPYGWNSTLSHERKLHSYQVEVNWYKEFSQTADKRCFIPKGLKTFQSKNESLIVMEDLSHLGFKTILKEADKTQLKTCLTWLANFHAKYLNIKSENIWKVGTYWHLDTRPDELEVLEDKELKSYAKQIDEKLNSSKYQTIVHGDAKLANFCFNEDGTSCSTVDFQYVGHGCAMKDVVLFMSSAVKPEDCQILQEWILDTYFEALHVALSFYHSSINSVEIEKEYRVMFDIAWADFVRFLKGWKPNHFKINSYSQSLTNKALEYIKSN